MEVSKVFKDAVILFLICVGGANANIDRLDLIMPKYAIKGGDVVLRCDHSVPNEQLYKVEWQKAERKIFQYIKGRSPPFRKFPAWLTGATVNQTVSNDKQLVLSNLNFSASGLYSCVVSTNTPIFSKDSESHVLTVIEPQADNPNITYTKDRYEVGDTLEVNCTSSPSRPPAHITWYINDMKAPENLTKSYFNGKIHGYFEQKASATKQLSIEVSDLHVGENGLRLTCMATIPGFINDDETYADKKEHSVRVVCVVGKILLTVDLVWTNHMVPNDCATAVRGVNQSKRMGRG